jgi:hypothetical protein
LTGAAETHGDEMISAKWGRFLVNALLFVLIVPLVWLAVSWLAGLLLFGPSNSGYELNALALHWAILLPQMLVAALLQQVTTLFLPRLGDRAGRLLATIVAVGSVVLVLFAVGGWHITDSLSEPNVFGGLVVAGAAFAMVMRLPKDGSDLEGKANLSAE